MRKKPVGDFIISLGHLRFQWRSLPITEVQGSNPVTGKILIMNTFTVNCWKDKNKEKSGREWPNSFKKDFSKKTVNIKHERNLTNQSCVYSVKVATPNNLRILWNVLWASLTSFTTKCASTVVLLWY